MVIFHSYVSLPEGNSTIVTIGSKESLFTMLFPRIWQVLGALAMIDDGELDWSLGVGDR
jgi:inorganic pyrophosphatase